MLAAAGTSGLLHDPPLVLLVDHDADTRQMYAQFLHTVPYTTEEAGDGRVALAKALTFRPDVLVTETRLPGLSGYDLCRTLREDRDTTRIGIVMVTGDAFASQLARAEAAGADTVLVKPCLPDVLAQAIQRLFVRSSAVRERADRVMAKAALGVQRANETIAAARALRATLSRTHRRGDTTRPPLPPPALRCTHCDAPLKYIKSHVGGVSARHQEQWDHFECANGCGAYEYRQRTRRMRQLT